MRKNNRLFSSILFFVITIIFAIPLSVNAAGEHGLSTKAVVCDSSIYNSSDYEENAANCYGDYIEGNLNTYIKENGTVIDPGTFVMIVVEYHLGAESEVTGINATLQFDNNVWTPLTDSTGEFLGLDNAESFPQGTKLKKAQWNSYVTLDDSTGNIIVYVDEASTYKYTLDDDYEIGYFFMTVNSDVPAGNVDITFKKDNIGGTKVVDGDGNRLDYVTDDISFTIPGEATSHDASLGSLSITNSDTAYILDPSFTAGSVENKVYNTVVPYDISQIMINATTNDAGANILPADLGKKTLSLGMNTFTITITSAFGNVETYTVNIYRLSNDASLNSITLTNGVSFGNMISGQYTYSTSVTYATSSTSISATPTHTNAFVDSGEGTWNLTNFGTQTNTKTVVVKAENCKSEYSSVPGNTCTVQNYNLTINRDAPSTNAYLKNITVDTQSLNQFSNGKVTFNKTILEYDLGEVAYDKTSVNLNALVDDTGKSKVSGLGNKTLNVGENTFNIDVVAEDGSTTLTYTVKIYRLSNDSLLKSLKVESVPQTSASIVPSFNSSVNEYKFTYDETVGSFTLTADVNDTDKAKIAIYDTTPSEYVLNSNSASFGLDTTSVVVSVQAEDGTINNYIVNFERQKSSDTSLQSLSLDNGILKPDFTSDNRLYSTVVEPNIDHIEVNAVPNSVYGTIKEIKGNNNLQFGTGNQIEVIVEAEDKKTSSYVINVERKKYNDATLSDIKVNGVSIEDFDPSTNSYVLEAVPFETTSINIEGIKNNEYATVDGNGDISLSTGENVITIKVTAQNGDVNNYTLNIKRAKNSDNSISNLRVKGYNTTLVGPDNSIIVYEVTLPNEISSIVASDVTFDYPSDATNVYKDESLVLSTTNSNDYSFTVVSESGSPQIYSIKIKREKSSAAEISKVVLSIGEDDSRYCLMDSTNKCKIEVPVDTLNFSLYSFISDEATISPAQDTEFELPASQSEKDVVLIVTAEDGTSNTYTVTVARQKSSNNDASDITMQIGDGPSSTIDNFNSTKLNYDITVNGDTSSVVIGAVVDDLGKAKIAITNSTNGTPETINYVTDSSSKTIELEFDRRNTVEIFIKAENGQVKTYTLYITRLHRSDATLSNLTVNGITVPGFTSGEVAPKTYTLSNVDYNTSNLNIMAIPTDENATKTGDGIQYLNTGDNSILITVTAHDGTIGIYTIEVNRAKNSDKRIKDITLAGVSATYNSSSGHYEVTVPNNIDIANSTNLVVNVYEGKENYDALASVTFDPKDLLTTELNSMDIKVTAEDNSVSTYVLDITRTKSNVATLSSLTVSNGSFNPSFNSNLFEYTVTVPVDLTEFDVSAVTTEGHAIINSGTGHYEMTESNMDISVLVTSEDLSVTETYILHVTRTKSSVNTLNSITVTSGSDETLINYSLSPEFSSNVVNYTVNVPGDIEEVDISAIKTDPLATIESGLGSVPLNVGDNTVLIKVKSESGAYNTYTIKIVRAKKFNNYLSSLVVSSGSGDTYVDYNIPFDKDTLEYVIPELTNNITSLKIDATTEDGDATITGTGSVSLAVGDNDLNVIVTAQDGTKRTYVIKVKRAASDNNFLKNLFVNGYTLSPKFNKNTLNYEVEVLATKATFSSSDVTAILEDSTASISYDETMNLSFVPSDNFFKITVTAQNGDERVYTINVKRKKSSDATLKLLNLTGGSLNPEFNKSRNEYTLTLPYGGKEFTIEGIANDDNATVSGNGTYNIDSIITPSIIITVTAQDGTFNSYKFNIVETKSNDDSLASLSVQGYPLDKTFVTTTFSYSIGDVPFGTTGLIINASATNPEATIKYYVDNVLQTNNIVALPQTPGEKVITVRVTAADGITQSKVYSIKYNLVYSDNTYLKTLSPSVGTLDFLKTKQTYTLNLANSVDSVTFTIETEHPGASVSVNDGDRSFTTPAKTVTINDLVVGDTLLKVVVYPENGNDSEARLYQVVINRAEPEASSDNFLSSLSVDGYTLSPEFNASTNEYSIGSIPYALETLTINATLNDGKANIKYLVNGVNQENNVVNVPRVEGTGAIVVQVIAENGNVNNYKITYNKIPSSNAYLSELIVSEGSIEFNKETFNYEVNVPRNVNSVDITARVEDETSILKMNSYIYSSPHTLTISNLKPGNTEVIILVTAENGTTYTYVVTLKKEANVSEVITSVQYGHTIVNDYIESVKLHDTVLKLKNELDNENQYLEIWTADDQQKLSDGDTLATGMIVKLIIDGEEKDRKLIVIKGDIVGDGEVELFDAVQIVNHVLGTKMLEGAYKEAGLIVSTDDVELFDAVQIVNHVLGTNLMY
ncbi:MAG: cadherin-like beta sandwich domain-containing protein [Bacilli bacterium]|nr:cadherin-like beta sandwich domain-containing protein [Bacilli bacterium]